MGHSCNKLSSLSTPRSILTEWPALFLTSLFLLKSSAAGTHDYPNTVDEFMTGSRGLMDGFGFNWVDSGKQSTLTRGMRHDCIGSSIRGGVLKISKRVTAGKQKGTRHKIEVDGRPRRGAVGRLDLRYLGPNFRCHVLTRGMAGVVNHVGVGGVLAASATKVAADAFWGSHHGRSAVTSLISDILARPRQR